MPIDADALALTSCTSSSSKSSLPSPLEQGLGVRDEVVPTAIDTDEERGP